jgi:hypothetical protein
MKPYNMTTCREVKERENVRERYQERNIRSMQIGGVILFPMISKGEKEKYQKSKSQVYGVRKGLSIEGILSGGVTTFNQKRGRTWKET